MTTMTMEQYQQWLQSPDGQKWQASQQPVITGCCQGFTMAGGQLPGAAAAQDGVPDDPEEGAEDCDAIGAGDRHEDDAETGSFCFVFERSLSLHIDSVSLHVIQVVRYEKQKKTRMVNKVIQVEEEYEVEVGLTETETYEVPMMQVTQVPVETEEIVNEVVAVQVEQEPIMEKFVQYVQPVVQYEYKEVEVPVEEYEEVEVEETSYEYQWSDQVRAMDVNNDGQVSSAEFQTWMAQQSSAQQAAMLKAMDANNDGKVTLAEQQAFLQQQMSQGSVKAP